MSARAAAAADLAKALGHAFADPDRLERALTHASVGDGAKKISDNERLEFLGDRVLGLLTAERLIALYPDAREGELAVRLNALVNWETCARVARGMALGPALRLSGAETRAGGRDKDSILADAAEAVIAAVYQDGGLSAARDVFDRFWGPELARGDGVRNKDAKTAVQEWAHARALAPPSYVVVDRRGADHAPVFTVEATIAGFDPVRADGGSRQAAEKAAAASFLEREAGEPEGKR